MIWFSASCNCPSLPNSLGLPAFPLRMISVCGSNKLTNFSRKLGYAFEDTRLRLPHHAAHALLRTFFFRLPAFFSICCMVRVSAPRPIMQQATIGGIVNVALNHSGVHSHLPPTDHSSLLRYTHDPIVQFAYGIGPDRRPRRTSVFSSGTFSVPIRQNVR